MKYYTISQMRDIINNEISKYPKMGDNGIRYDTLRNIIKLKKVEFLKFEGQTKVYDILKVLNAIEMTKIRNHQRKRIMLSALMNEISASTIGKIPVSTSEIRDAINSKIFGTGEESIEIRRITDFLRKSGLKPLRITRGRRGRIYDLDEVIETYTNSKYYRLIEPKMRKYILEVLNEIKTSKLSQINIESSIGEVSQINANPEPKELDFNQLVEEFNSFLISNQIDLERSSIEIMIKDAIGNDFKLEFKEALYKIFNYYEEMEKYEIIRYVINRHLSINKELYNEDFIFNESELAEFMVRSHHYSVEPVKGLRVNELGKITCIEVEGQLYDIIPRNENTKHDRIIGNVLKNMN